MAGAKRLWCKRLLEYFCLAQVLGMTCFGSCFAAERPRRGKPVKSRVANFSRKEGATFEFFWLWEETGYVWDVVAAAKRLWCKRLLEYSCLVQVLGMTCFGL